MISQYLDNWQVATSSTWTYLPFQLTISFWMTEDFIFYQVWEQANKWQILQYKSSHLTELTRLYEYKPHTVNTIKKGVSSIAKTLQTQIYALHDVTHNWFDFQHSGKINTTQANRWQKCWISSSRSGKMHVQISVLYG